ncbi:hypothetical protein PGB90_005507 [Kerria lacca]
MLELPGAERGADEVGEGEGDNNSMVMGGIAEEGTDISRGFLETGSFGGVVGDQEDFVAEKDCRDRG